MKTAEKSKHKPERDDPESSTRKGKGKKQSKENHPVFCIWEVKQRKQESPCSLVFHEVGTLLEELGGLPKNWPTHCAGGQSFLPVPHLIPPQQSSANTEPHKHSTENRHENSH